MSQTGLCLHYITLDPREVMLLSGGPGCSNCCLLKITSALSTSQCMGGGGGWETTEVRNRIYFFNTYCITLIKISFYNDQHHIEENDGEIMLI